VPGISRNIPELCIKIFKNQLAQYSEDLPHNSEVWGSIHIPAVASSEEPHLGMDVGRGLRRICPFDFSREIFSKKTLFA